MKIHKLNESHSLLIPNNDIDKNELLKIHDYLKVIKPDAHRNFKIQKGWESPYRYFTESVKDNNGAIALKILNGHLDLINNIFNLGYAKDISLFSEQNINETFNQIFDMLPFKPYDYQELCAKECIRNTKHIALACTGSGKSLIIFMIIYFFYLNNKKGFIIVPNISLVNQLLEDFKDYIKDETIRDEFVKYIELQGGGNTSSFGDSGSFLTITTWQSLMNRKEHLNKADFIICDELHRYSSEETSEIVLGTRNAYYKIGLTGTLPEDPGAKLYLFGMFGTPRRYIRTSELISRGLGTPIEIYSIILNYNDQFKNAFKSINKKQYLTQLKYIQEYEYRNKFIVNLTCRVKEQGNTLVLFQHTQHGKDLFIETMKKLYPDVEVQNKDITGKKSFEFQEKYGVYFLNGEDDPITREKTRKILEEHTNAVLIANYALLSTGVNIKALFNMIFASPLKAFTTISQSIGRGIRLHPNKKVFNVYDIIDNFGTRVPGGIFWKQYSHRKSSSYLSEDLPVKEIHHLIKET